MAFKALILEKIIYRNCREKRTESVFESSRELQNSEPENIKYKLDKTSHT